jgi:hypothetical protein
LWLIVEVGPCSAGRPAVQQRFVADVGAGVELPMNVGDSAGWGQIAGLRCWAGLLTFRVAERSIGVSDVRKQEPDRVAPAGVPGFEQLFRQAAPGLWRTIFAFAGGRAAVADDAVAEAFARALERFGQIREPVPWLYRTAFRIAAEELRRKEPAA